MTTVIEFLEQMGSDAKLRSADSEEVGRAMEMAGLDASARDAILTDDQGSLEALLGASANVFCGLEAPADAPADGETPPQPVAPPASKKRSSKKKKKKSPAKKKPAPKKKKAPASKRAGKKKGSKKKSSKKKVSRKKK